ncbi:MAG: phage baseplate protein [Actinomycetota bacterium]|nr:phage baseplate protein [Actinomycetota bacterium]
MRPLSPSTLLEVWEREESQTPVRRALSLLAAAEPETPTPRLAELPVGRRDARLLTLREWTFGPRVTAVAECSGCGQVLELEFEIEQVRAGDPPVSSPGVVTIGDWTVTFRAPNSLDLEAATQTADVRLGRDQLLRRCIVSIRRGGEEVEELPEDVLETLGQHMAELDAQANVRLDVSCPGCGRHWTPRFDILSYFWTEIRAWAARILAEVHELASAYGWSERTILAMSAERRRRYLELVRR